MRDLLPADTTKDDMTKPPSFFVLQRIPYGPQNDTDGTSILLADRFDAYMGHRCWRLQLELSLVAWNLIKRSSFQSDLKPMFETLHSGMWKNHVDAVMCSEDHCHAMLEYCAKISNRKASLHDPSSPLLNGLMRLLSIKGGPRKKREIFKAPIYVVVACILMHLESSRNADLATSLEEFSQPLDNKLTVQCRNFLVEVALPFVVQKSSAKVSGRGTLFQHFLEANPRSKTGMQEFHAPKFSDSRLTCV
eukprot:CAMPEP_0168739966 /NCGR_PEP_ID=MMETSP0724-20121128/11733_1 /TAXON_ID=265536 /ORGANISM="Amphiprora sp., Strain CCMP467" /LENGTH=247 /DNA_ID=CAMNT_0008787381 /DNA_START=631 /DNA_END=1374 /DNA_ORIENTATION=-